MESHSSEVLGFPDIRERLVQRCPGGLGRERALGLGPLPDLDAVAAELDRVDELLALGEEPGVAGVANIVSLLDRSVQGSVLTGPELLSVGKLCAAIRQYRSFFDKRQDRTPKLWSVAQGLAAQPDLEKDLERCLDERGDVLDDATPELSRARRETRRLRGRLVTRLEKMASENPDFFGDRPTVRKDRFVLPVRVEAREQVQGVVHESSGSGQTLFIEPMETLAEQNRLAELRSLETEETAKVFRTLTMSVARAEKPLRVSIELVATLELTVAKKRLSVELRCTRPEVVEPGKLRIVEARHPLLALRGTAVVPLAFEFPEGRCIVVVSGPNAGGKTVVLKTLGLLSLMVRHGLHVPAAEGTRLPLYDKVLADIGDEQSLDADLSSFTAHLLRLKAYLKQSDQRSLVLLDEIGSSTAPEEGAALAMAVLESFRDRGVHVVATSHFGALKVLVQDEPGMTNAAMGFRDGKPTFRLVMGIPGESSAFDIAARVGFPARTLDRARARMGPGWLDLSDRLRSLSEELERARDLRKSADENERRARRVRDVYEEKLAALKQRESDEQERLRLEREELLTSKRREIENLVRDIRESQAEREHIVRAKRFIEQELGEVASAAPETQGQQADGRRFGAGDFVESSSLKRRGEVIETARDLVTVAFGSIKMQLAPDDLVLLQRDEKPVDTSPVFVEPYHFNPRLKILGMRVDEASEALDGFMREAVSAGAKELAILHGKGTGALQSMVWEQLKRDRRVERLAFADNKLGGSGVTLVYLKDGDD